MNFNDIPYTRIDYEKTAETLNELLNRLEKCEKPDDFIACFRAVEKINEHNATMATLASIRHTMNTADPFYEAENDFWDETGPLLQEYSSRESRIALAFKDRSALLKVIPETYFQLAECEVKSFDPKIIPLLQKENKLASEYGKLKASAQIIFEGETYNLSGISAKTEDSDRAVRKAAFDAKMAFYKKNQEAFDRIYDEMVQVRTEMAHQLGYQTFTELAYYRMNRLDYDQEMVANYRKQVLEELVPFCSELYQRQAKRIGVDQLAYYDENYQFITGNPKPAGDAQSLIDAAVSMYHELSQETGEFIDVMNQNQLWDLMGRDNKELGAYTTSIEEQRVPFIFANSNGTSGDVDTLTHEAGHAFQYYMARNIEFAACRWPTMESCEIHSMSMEFLTYPYMERFFGKDTKKFYFSHLCGALTFLPYGILIDHFQHEVYNHPEMTIAERKACFRKLEKMYLPHRNYEGCDLLEEGCWWYQQGHVFASPFYYIDYCLAQICALQFWQRSHKNDPNTFNDYLHLCSLGGTMSFTKLVKEAHLISPFEDGCLKDVVAEARAYLKTIDDADLA